MKMTLCRYVMLKDKPSKWILIITNVINSIFSTKKCDKRTEITTFVKISAICDWFLGPGSAPKGFS